MQTSHARTGSLLTPSQHLSFHRPRREQLDAMNQPAGDRASGRTDFALAPLASTCNHQHRGSILLWIDCVHSAWGPISLV